MGPSHGLVLAPNSAPKWLKQTFDEADKNGDGSLSISEVLQLLHKLNVNLPRQRVKQMFRVSEAAMKVAGGWGVAHGCTGRSAAGKGDGCSASCPGGWQGGSIASGQRRQ